MSFVKQIVNNNNANARLAGQQRLNISQGKQLADAQINASQAGAIADHNINKNKHLANEVEDLEYANAKLRKERDFYKTLLSKPMVEIASYSEDFKETYFKQQEILADWIVSQKAFKEVAMKYGTQSGKTAEEIKKEGLDTEIKVLENNTKFNNDVSTSPLADKYKEKLKKKKG